MEWGWNKEREKEKTNLGDFVQHIIYLYNIGLTIWQHQFASYSKSVHCLNASRRHRQALIPNQ